MEAGRLLKEAGQCPYKAEIELPSSTLPLVLSIRKLRSGVPYADYSDPVVKAQIRYFNGKRRGMGERWNVMDAFRAANQAMGRGIRHRDDWCNFILMDHRYQTHLKLLSKWAVVNGVQKIPN